VHHVTHWINGGTTSIDNAALLCERHHVIVHRDNITATVTKTGVRWHLERPRPSPARDGGATRRG
ncbi:MAG TPA: HNH endonuclease, partial [Segeticoccus sp.]|nr:HNH endonuclease [Segeticoccus sp.]